MAYLTKRASKFSPKKFYSICPSFLVECDSDEEKKFLTLKSGSKQPLGLADVILQNTGKLFSIKFTLTRIL